MFHMKKGEDPVEKGRKQGKKAIRCAFMKKRKFF